MWLYETVSGNDKLSLNVISKFSLTVESLILSCFSLLHNAKLLYFAATETAHMAAGLPQRHRRGMQRLDERNKGKTTKDGVTLESSG